MKRQAAFIEKGRMLKGNLHCHTTRSDGKTSPEELIRYYYDHGYDFLALTDHLRYNHENFAPELPIVIVPGMEHDTAPFESGSGFRVFHTVCIGPSVEDGNGIVHDERFPHSFAQGQEPYQPELDEFHRKNNLTIYCHPQWSGTYTRHFEKLEGNFALEVWNSGCARACDMDRDAACWDELLGQGKRIYGVAGDDCHGLEDACYGWVMVRAEKNLNAILAALKNGEFYASCGPEIYDFYVDGTTAVVECSPAAKVRFHADMHPTRMVTDPQGLLTRAEFDLNRWPGEYNRYLRAVVIDNQGRYAWTNPIFFD